MDLKENILRGGEMMGRKKYSEWKGFWIMVLKKNGKRKNNKNV